VRATHLQNVAGLQISEALQPGSYPVDLRWIASTQRKWVPGRRRTRPASRPTP
jgi:hypothetical protein